MSDLTRKFQEEFLVPLEPKVRKLLDAVHRLSDLMTRAHSDCESYNFV